MQKSMNEKKVAEKNSQPISLPPITEKILMKFFGFFTENNLISDNQLGFLPGDSCINQLLSPMKLINLLIIIFKSKLHF